MDIVPLSHGGSLPGATAARPARARRCLRSAAALVAVGLAALLAGCADPPQAPLRVGLNPWQGYDPMALARQLGWLDPQQVRVVEYGAPSRVLRAFANGDIEAAALTLYEVLQLAEQGKDLRVVAVLDFSNGGDALLARADLASGESLRGRRVGAETTALGAFMLARALTHLGLSRGEVQIVPLAYDAHEGAFLRREVDAVVSFEPVRSRLLAAGARVLFDSSRIRGEVVDVLAVSGQHLARNPAQVAHLIRGWNRGVAFLHEQPRQAAQRLAAGSGLSAEAYLASLARIEHAAGAENMRLLQGSPPPLAKTALALRQAMLEAGLLRQPIPVEPLFTDRPLALAESER